MMGRVNHDQEQLFYSFRLDDAVPADHPVRAIAEVLDFSWVHSELAPFYPKMGRPSVDPELMIRMLIIGYAFAIRSERALCRDVQVNFAYRWFCRLSIEDKIPDHSAFSRARHERFRDSDMFCQVFERVVEACIAAGLVGGEGFAVDASLIVADANKQRSIPGSEWNEARGPQVANRAMKEYLATLDDAAFGSASDVTPKFVSPSDPAAQWTGAMRGPAFFAYADNYLIDVKFGIIMDVKASRAIRQAEVGAAKTMIERTQERFGIKPTFLLPIRPMARRRHSTGSSTRRRLHRTFQSSTNQPVRMGLSRERTSCLTRNVTSTSARTTSCCTPLERCVTEIRFAIAPPSSIVMSVHSRCSAVPTRLHGRSLAISTKTPAMLLVHWPRPKLSSDHAVIARSSRCCSLISNAS
jgi:transposase